MASVHLEFVAPDVQDLVSLHIYESSSSLGPFTIIDSVTGIGSYPDYISEYTTANAVSETNWFAIEWIDSKGATSDLSQPVKGDTQTALGAIVDRVMLRDPTLNREIVVQEAEAALYQMGIDPYGPAEQMTPTQTRGLTNMTLAMCYVVTGAGAVTASEYIAGIVSQKISDTALKGRQDAIKALIAAANKDLGLDYSVVALMALANDNGLCGTGKPRLFGAELDQTRLLVEVL
jgi:hypothetical protein